MLSQPDKNLYNEQGYLLVKGLFSVEEIALYRDHFMRLREAGEYPGDMSGIPIGTHDPLLRYPRMINMHRWDALSLSWLLDKRLNACMTALLGREPFAVQTMLYFKPPKARGQALHQDNYYLRVKPGNCIAAWLALDDCDVENGCLQVVPGSQRWDLLCSQKADVSQSFTDVTVAVPPGNEIEPVVMQEVDVLFFNGHLVHGSYPNTSENRFRRALIGHYIEGVAEEVYDWYHPVLKMDGNPVEIGYSPGGSRCGIWVDQAGQPVIEMSGYEQIWGKGE
jgi:phytanoyl-CoA hydroxylase